MNAELWGFWGLGIKAFTIENLELRVQTLGGTEPKPMAFPVKAEVPGASSARARCAAPAADLQHPPLGLRRIRGLRPCKQGKNTN